jgi:hypothetical protein
MMQSDLLRMIFFVGFCSISLGTQSQLYVNDADGKQKHFIYEVKQIDEFFERFNNDTSSFIRGVYRNYHVKYNLNRSMLIKSLFNYESKTWDTTNINNFVSSVTDKKNPCNLDFYGDNWFAEVVCNFKYNSDVVRIPLILKVVTVNNRGAKWVVAGVGSNPIKTMITVNKMSESKNSYKCIGPSSQAANFIALKKAFSDKENLSNFFDESFFDRLNAMEFYNAILNNQIEFLYVKSIKYHFLQDEGWIFKVEYFPRDALNSGWLINYIKKVSPGEMENYKRKLLGYK